MVMKKKLVVIVVAIAMLFSVAGCTQASKVEYNLTKDADNFNAIRKVTVINCILGDVVFQMEGRISITADTMDNQLEVIVEYEEGKYQKHMIGLSDNTIYTVEQIGIADVDNYNYVLNYNPKMWFPIDIENID